MHIIIVRTENVSENFLSVASAVDSASDTDTLIAELTKLKTSNISQRQQQRMIVRLATANMHYSRTGSASGSDRDAAAESEALVDEGVLRVEQEQLRHMLRSLISAARTSLETNPLMQDFSSQCLRIIQQATAGGNCSSGGGGGSGGGDGATADLEDSMSGAFEDIGDELCIVFGGVIEHFIETKVVVLEDFLVQRISEFSSILGSLYDPASQTFLSSSITETLTKTLGAAGASCGRDDMMTAELRESIFMNVSSCVSTSCALLNGVHSSAASMSEVEDQLLEKVMQGWARLREQLNRGLLRGIRAVLAFAGVASIESVAAEVEAAAAAAAAAAATQPTATAPR